MPTISTDTNYPILKSYLNRAFVVYVNRKAGLMGLE